ncbi:MAG: BTAD domain-containing putative transcriptional regulator, partial [Gemmatimonadota bacterium]|nr:BTAD domain-containing putative transcriptional regulator [Gemmatimonadota bacterium]
MNGGSLSRRGAMFDVKLLGGASIEGETGPLTGPAVQRHRLALLALLAVAYPKGITRDKLVALLWPERDAESSRGLLNQAVHHLRKVLGPDALLSTADELRLGPDRVHVDLLEFREALAASSLERAAAAYGGSFLDGFFLPDAVEFEHWTDGECQRLRQDYLRVLEDLAESAAAADDRRGAVDWWRRTVEEDAYNARFTLRLMEALEATGDRVEAIRRGEEHAERLRRELGAEPHPEIEDLVDRMRATPRALEDVTDRLPARAGIEVAATPIDRSSGIEADVRPPVSHVASAERRGSARKAVAAILGLAALVGAGLVGAMLVSGETSSSSTGRSPGDEVWIAVLPFEDLAETTDEPVFTDAVHSDLIVALTGVGSLRVISRTSVLPYRDRVKPLSEVAEELGVDVVVEGGVQRLGERVRVGVQLTDPRSGGVLWADSFTRDLTMENLFEIRRRVV